MAWPLSLRIDSIAVYSTELMDLCKKSGLDPDDNGPAPPLRRCAVAHWMRIGCRTAGLEIHQCAAHGCGQQWVRCWGKNAAAQPLSAGAGFVAARRQGSLSDGAIHRRQNRQQGCRDDVRVHAGTEQGAS